MKGNGRGVCRVKLRLAPAQQSKCAGFNMFSERKGKGFALVALHQGKQKPMQSAPKQRGREKCPEH